MSNFDCLISYLNAKRDLQAYTDREWDAATAVIDWLVEWHEGILKECEDVKRKLNNNRPTRG